MGRIHGIWKCETVPLAQLQIVGDNRAANCRVDTGVPDSLQVQDCLAACRSACATVTTDEAG